MSATETKGTAVITGASSGIGPIYADRLAKRGYDMILVARNRSRLGALPRRLEDQTGRSVETIAADLNDKADLARIETTPSRPTATTSDIPNQPALDVISFGMAAGLAGRLAAGREGPLVATEFPRI